MEDELDPRLSLPVWLQPPNWESGLLENWEFKTWVCTSEAEVEQRVSQRRFPRRTLDVPYRGFGIRSTLLQNLMAINGKQEWLMPLWMHKAKLTESVAEGAVTLKGDFRAKRFAAGELVLIRGVDLFDFFVAVIEDSQDAAITVAQPMEKAWPKGCVLHPLRVFVAVDQASATARSGNAVDVTIRFEQRTPERHIPSFGSMPTHPVDGLPVVNLKNNWREEPSIQFSRQVFELDNQQAPPHYFDVGGQSALTSSWRLMTRGRDDLAEFISLLYYMRGRQNLVWLPTHTEDIRVIEQVIPEQGELVVARAGYAQYGVTGQDIRRDVVFFMRDGTLLFNRIVSARVVGDVERLVLADNLEQAYQPADFKRIAYVSHARLDTDSIEIQHHADSDGNQEVALPFRSFVNRRDF